MVSSLPELQNPERLVVFWLVSSGKGPMAYQQLVGTQEHQEIRLQQLVPELAFFPRNPFSILPKFFEAQNLKPVFSQHGRAYAPTWRHFLLGLDLCLLSVLSHSVPQHQQRGWAFFLLAQNPKDHFFWLAFFSWVELWAGRKEWIPELAFFHLLHWAGFSLWKASLL